MHSQFRNPNVSPNRCIVKFSKNSVWIEIYSSKKIVGVDHRCLRGHATTHWHGWIVESAITDSMAYQLRNTCQ